MPGERCAVAVPDKCKPLSYIVIDLKKFIIVFLRVKNYTNIRLTAANGQIINLILIPP